MILNSRNSNFIFGFPKGFFYSEIDEKYKEHFNRSHQPYKNVTDYMNFTIQSSTWPSVSLETVEQSFRNTTQNFKGGYEAERQRNHEFSMTFRTTEGYLNYFIMEDQINLYWEYNNYQNKKDNKIYMPDMNLYLLDDTGHLITTRVYKNIVISGISDLDLSYNSNMAEFNTFTVDFKSTRIINRQLTD